MKDLSIIETRPGCFSVLGLNDMNIETILMSGQFHLWEKVEDGYYVVEHKGKITAVRSLGDQLDFSNTREEDIINHWLPWLDMESDYQQIGKALSFDPYCKQATLENPGLRILRQSPYEASLQFIMSANNNISRMMKAFQQMSACYGKEGPTLFGKTYALLPEAATLARVDPLELRETCKVGYRDQALVALGRDISSGKFSIDQAKRMTDQELFTYLQTLQGVGPKVAQCIMLYGYHRMGSFPIDVWIKRIMVSLYQLEGRSNKEIGEFAQDRFGENAGFAQQLLFMYAREHREIFD